MFILQRYYKYSMILFAFIKQIYKLQYCSFLNDKSHEGIERESGESPEQYSLL